MYDKNYFNLVFSGKDQSAQTPEWLWEGIKESGGMTDVFDPCPPNPTQDGLAIHWRGQCIVNPPYNEAAKWLDKGLNEWNERRVSSVFILPFRPSRRYFHEYVQQSSDFFVLSKRVAFKGYTRPFPGPICLICFGISLDRTVWENKGMKTHRVPMLLKSFESARGYSEELQDYLKGHYGRNVNLETIIGSPKSVLESNRGEGKLYMTLPFVNTDYFQNNIEKVSSIVLLAPVLVLEGYTRKSLLGSIVISVGSLHVRSSGIQYVTFLV